MDKSKNSIENNEVTFFGWKLGNTLYILQKLFGREILDSVSRDYAQYAWSLGTLSRRLAYFHIKYIEYNTDLKEVEAALHCELQGPGQLLGYRSM